MKNKNIKRLIVVIAIIIILLIIAIIILRKNSKESLYSTYDDVHIENYSDEEFVIDNKFKYKVLKETNSNFEPMTQYPVATEETRYYEINFENNIVELREDFLPTLYYKKSNYSMEEDFYKGKLIDKKELTSEEKNELKQLLDKVIKEGKTNFTNRDVIIYYRISNPGQYSIVMDNVEDIRIFKEIINF